jgi:hypothetical protein
VTNQLHSAVDRLAAAVRDVLRWFALLVVSPTGFGLLSWWKGRKKPKTDEITPERKSFLERRKEIRDERKRRRDD